MNTKENQNFCLFLKKSTGVTTSIFLSEIDCVAFDGFGMLHILQKTKQIKTYADLVMQSVYG